MFKLNLTVEEILYIQFNLPMSDAPEGLAQKLYKAEDYSPPTTKILATRKATEIRSKKAKEKIQNAINLLQFENKAITHYSIARTSGVSFNTVKKHISDLDIIGKL